MNQLTKREWIILRLVAEFPNKQVASKLHISEQTVKNHLKSAYGKLGVNRAIDAFRIVGWLTIPSAIPNESVIDSHQDR